MVYLKWYYGMRIDTCPPLLLVILLPFLKPVPLYKTLFEINEFSFYNIGPFRDFILQTVAKLVINTKENSSQTEASEKHGYHADVTILRAYLYLSATVNIRRW